MGICYRSNSELIRILTLRKGALQNIQQTEWWKEDRLGDQSTLSLYFLSCWLSLGQDNIFSLILAWEAGQSLGSGIRCEHWLQPLLTGGEGGSLVHWFLPARPYWLFTTRSVLTVFISLWSVPMRHSILLCILSIRSRLKTLSVLFCKLGTI